MRRQIPALFSLALVLILGLMLTGSGCGGSSTDGSASSAGSTTTLTVTTAESESTTTTQAPGEHLREAKLNLTQIVDVPVTDMQASTGPRESPDADVVLEWQGGRAEVDSSTGRIYLVAIDRPQGNSFAPFMAAPDLESLARRTVSGLGWKNGMLAGLGFKQQRTGSLSEGTGLYTATWTQHDGEGTREDGLVEVQLDGRTGRLVRFSVSLGTQGLDIAGAMGEDQALDIAQTEIYLKTDKVKIQLAGDGSLILLNKSVSEELKMLEDKKITGGEPLLVWVITITGTAASQAVGGTVYIDATTGEVLEYVAAPAE